MGGSGGHSSNETGRPNSDEYASCDQEFDVNIFGPVKSVTDNLAVGDLLSVELTGNDDIVGVFTPDGDQAGTITGTRHLPTLVKCLLEEQNYQAKVISAEGSRITISVRKA